MKLQEASRQSDTFRDTVKSRGLYSYNDRHAWKGALIPIKNSSAYTLFLKAV